MELTAAMIATYLEGEVEGNPDTKVSEFAKIEEGTEGKLAFLSNPKYEHYLYTTEASIVLVNRSLKLKHPVKPTLIRVDDSYGALAKILTYIESQRPKKKGIHPTAIIEDSAIVGQDVYIGPYVYVGEGAVIEDEVQLYPHLCRRYGARACEKYSICRCQNLCEMRDRRAVYSACGRCDRERRIWFCTR